MIKGFAHVQATADLAPDLEKFLRKRSAPADKRQWFRKWVNSLQTRDPDGLAFPEGFAYPKGFLDDLTEFKFGAEDMDPEDVQWHGGIIGYQLLRDKAATRSAKATQKDLQDNPGMQPTQDIARTLRRQLPKQIVKFEGDDGIMGFVRRVKTVLCDLFPRSFTFSYAAQLDKLLIKRKSELKEDPDFLPRSGPQIIWALMKLASDEFGVILTDDDFEDQASFFTPDPQMYPTIGTLVSNTQFYAPRRLPRALQWPSPPAVTRGIAAPEGKARQTMTTPAEHTGTWTRNAADGSNGGQQSSRGKSSTTTAQTTQTPIFTKGSEARGSRTSPRKLQIMAEGSRKY